MPNIGFEIKRKCSVCGKVFIAKTLDSVYCSTKCGKVAYKRRKEIEAREKKLALIAKMVPTIREYISVKEAVAIYGVERGTLYRHKLLTNFSKNSFYLLPEPLRRGEFLTNY